MPKPLPLKLRTKIKIPSPPEEYWDFLYDSTAKVDLLQNKKRLEKYKEEVRHNIFQEQCIKMDALFQHFDIDVRKANKWEQLAWALARHHVGGLEVIVEKTRGRKKLDKDLLVKLYLEVERVRDLQRSRKTAGTIISACKSLVKNEPWKSQYKAKTLANMYQQALADPYVQSLLAAREEGADLIQFTK